MSIPGISGKIERSWQIEIEYYDENFVKQVRKFGGTTARMIQHEYDHTEGVLYLDYLKPLTRTLIKNKLRKIANGLMQPSYPMKFVI